MSVLLKRCDFGATSSSLLLRTCDFCACSLLFCSYLYFFLPVARYFRFDLAIFGPVARHFGYDLIFGFLRIKLITFVLTFLICCGLFASTLHICASSLSFSLIPFDFCACSSSVSSRACHLVPLGVHFC